MNDKQWRRKQYFMSLAIKRRKKKLEEQHYKEVEPHVYVKIP